jgi:predicted nucleic acid-binding Zn ribbon protein
MLTAPGFHLKGSGWYATDFKGGKGTPKTEDESKSSQPAPACGAGACPACST